MWGVAIFVHESLCYTKRNDLCINCETTESLSIEISNSDVKNILDIVYRPPDGDLEVCENYLGICVSRAGPPALNLFLPDPAINLYFAAPATNLYLPAPTLNLFSLTALALNLCLLVLRFVVKVCYSYSVYLCKRLCTCFSGKM